MKAIKNDQFKRMLVLTGMAFFSFLLYAGDSGVIKGRVTDSNHHPVGYATTVLKNSKTNQFVAGTVCNDKGEYVIEDVDPGEYVLSINMIGYGKAESQKIVVETNRNRIVEKDVVLNEAPEKTIVVVAKKTSAENNLQTAQR